MPLLRLVALSAQVYPVIDSRAKSRVGREQTEKPSESSNVPRASLFEENTRAGGGDKKTKTAKARKLTAVQLKELEDQKEVEVATSWKRIQELWQVMLGERAPSEDPNSEKNRDAAAREWMMEAEKLVEMFRETRALFLTGKVCLHVLRHLRTPTLTSCVLEQLQRRHPT